MLPSLKDIFSKGAEKLVTAVGRALDDNITNKEERDAAKLAFEQALNTHAERMAELALKEIELANANTDSARTMNSKIQDSDSAGWFAKNTAYVLDFVFVIAFIVMLAMIFYKVVPESNKELFYMAFGLLGANVGNVINFHRGSSKDSDDKQRTLDRMSKR